MCEEKGLDWFLDEISDRTNHRVGGCRLFGVKREQNE